MVPGMALVSRESWQRTELRNQRKKMSTGANQYRVPASRLLLCLLAVVLVKVADGRAERVDCVTPSCVTPVDRATLWPFEDPNFYLQCMLGDGVSWELVREPCQGRRLFHFARQQCIGPANWELTCSDQPTEPLPVTRCPVAQCVTQQDVERLWPDPDPARFLQCIPQATGGIAPVQQDCAAGLLYSDRAQACIIASRWSLECTFDELTPGPTGGETEQPSTTPTSPPQTTTTGPGEWQLCQAPICEREDPRLYPSTVRTAFYQCVPLPDGFWVAQLRPCAAGTLFHYGLQLCVFPADWENFCPDQ